MARTSGRKRKRNALKANSEKIDITPFGDVSSLDKNEMRSHVQAHFNKIPRYSGRTGTFYI